MFAAVIFDMDGVISDTQGLHSEVESRVLAQHGIEVTAEYIDRHFSGIPSAQVFRTLLGEKWTPELGQELGRKKWEAMAQAKVFPLPGALELIQSLGRDYPLAVASSSVAAFVQCVLRSLGIWQCFSAVVSVEEVSKGKPDPDLFLLAAKRLSAAPEKCVVIEDSPHGIEGARRAGMKSIALDRFGYGTRADAVVGDLREITPKLLSALGSP